MSTRAAYHHHATHLHAGPLHTARQVFLSPPPRVLTLLVLIALLAAAALLLAWAAARTKRSHGAHFASRRELAGLRLRAGSPMPGRVTLGVHRRVLVAAEPRASVLVLGPSQSGKTTGLVVPALLEWSGPALSTSVKSDVVHDTYAARSARGEVRVFDPSACTRLPHTPWSPLAATTTWEGARRTAARLLGVGEQGAHSADETFWRPAGARFLGPLLLAAAHGDLTMREVLAWIATVEEREPEELLEACPDRGAKPALEALRSVWMADPRFRSSLLQTVATALDSFQEPTIAAATAGDCKITPGWLLEGSNTLYLISPADDQRRLRGLFAALISDIVAGAFARSTERGGPIEPALLLALDEAANIAPLANLDEIASTGPGQGVQLLTVLQNLSQASDRWGRERVETILANHRARVFCTGIGDQATLDHLRGTLGDEQVKRVSKNKQGALSTGSRTTSEDFRPLAIPDRIRQMPADRVLLVYGRLAPAWLRLRPWYAHPALKALAAGEPPAKKTSARIGGWLGRRTCPIMAAFGRLWGRRQATHQSAGPETGRTTPSPRSQP